PAESMTIAYVSPSLVHWIRISSSTMAPPGKGGRVSKRRASGIVGVRPSARRATVRISVRACRSAGVADLHRGDEIEERLLHHRRVGVADDRPSVALVARLLVPPDPRQLRLDDKVPHALLRLGESVDSRDAPDPGPAQE